MHITSHWMGSICEKGVEVNWFVKPDTNLKTFRILYLSL